MPFATNKPEYLNARRNSHFNVISPFFVLHETWARGEEELLNKINSWGHDNDFASKESYFNFWKILDEHNYIYVKDFHPLRSATWQKLGFIPELAVESAIKWLQQHGHLKVDTRHLIKTNSRIYQGLKHRFNKL
jgi:hypothetical protein